ncbi:MAG: 4-hydroxybenzoate synthetase [Cycloclasticus sp. symbiont of Poecilosclerida sp. N]|nr:MAG: 4-hydroxybenzoate synthetase [Cycloclasticus sp. symbiont of Poecilosclerida sp. N]
MPPRVLDWLTEPYSLTLKIKKTFVQPFNVQLQGQGLSKPFLADSRCLQQHICHHALIRETLLKVGDEAVVFARTTLPRKVARELQELTHLGTKPLGEVIFSYLDLQRVGLDFAKIKVDHLSPLMQQQLVGESYIWARRNTYRVNKQAFIVSEFFLPAIFSK